MQSPYRPNARSERVLSEPTSLTLLDGLLNQNEEFRTRFVDTYGPVIYIKCRKAGFDEHYSEDLTQDILLRVITYIHTFRRESPDQLFRKWLTTVVANWVNSCRKQNLYTTQSPGSDFEKAFDRLEDSLKLDDCFSIVDPDFLATEAMRKLYEKVEAKIGAISPAHWQIFFKYAVDNREAKDVAEEFNTSSENVRKIASRIRKRLENLGSREGFFEP